MTVDEVAMKFIEQNDVHRAGNEPPLEAIGWALGDEIGYVEGLRALIEIALAAE